MLIREHANQSVSSYESKHIREYVHQRAYPPQHTVGNIRYFILLILMALEYFSLCRVNVVKSFSMTQSIDILLINAYFILISSSE